MEILKIAEPCPLIDPSQVVVTQGEILTADPVLTPIGTFFKTILFLMPSLICELFLFFFLDSIVAACVFIVHNFKSNN